MTRLVYFFKTASASIRRNLVLNLVSVSIISLTLLILAAFLLIQSNIQRLADSSPAGLNVSVYLQNDLSNQDLEQLKRQVSQVDGVVSVDYVSKIQAMANLKAQLGDQGRLLDDLDQNPLPASLELVLSSRYRDKALVQGLNEQLAAMNGVDEIHFAYDWAEKLNAVIRFVKLSGFAMGGLLFLAVIFIIANTIRLTVIARQDELYILRLMGATEGFIRTPFFIEGMAQGAAGGLLALMGAYLIHVLFLDHIQLPFGLTDVKLVFLSGGLSLFIVLAGALLGLIGSQISLGRFKVR